MSMDESVSARAAAPQPAEVRRSRVFGDSRGERWASGLLGALMGSEAVLGMFISFTTVNEQMAPAFGNRAPLIPLGIDIGILVFGLADVLLTFWRIPKAMVRWFEWLLVTATIYLNASGAEAGWVRAAHITLPLLWVVSCEVVRHVVRDRLDVLTGTPTDPIPVLVWLMYPLYAFRTKRRMVRWQVKSYQQALLLDAALHSREARLEAEYGRKWRREAPPEERLAYRLRERIPASLLAQALVADAELDRAIAQAQGQAAPAALAAEAGATAMATAQIEALLSDTRELAANIVAGLAASRTLPGLADPGPAQGSADHADRRTLGSGPTAQTTVQPPAAGLRTLGADPSQGEGSADPDPRNHDQRTLGADPRTPGSEITGLADPGSAGLPDPRTLGLAHHGADRPQAQNEYAQAFPQPYQQLVITGEGPADSATAQESAGGTRTGYDQWPPAADPRNAAAADPRLPVFAAPTDPSLGEGSADPDPRNHDQRTLGADPRTLGSATAGPSGLEVRTAGPQGPQNPGARVPDPRRSLESGSGAPAADPRPPVEPLPQEAAADPTCGGLWSAETGDLARAVVAKLPTDTRTRATFLAAFRAAGGAIGNDRRGKLYAYAIAPDLPAPEESDEQDLVETANGHRH
jgi:hypothetical protein